MTLALEGADAFHGKAQALHQVSLEVRPGEIVSLIGRNGAGKTTTLRVLAGLMPLMAGRRTQDGADITPLPAHRLSRLGINYVPETRRIFPNLSVAENLHIATFAHRGGVWTVPRVLELFPRLAERRHAPGDALSGGEQQMLAIARGLLTTPKFLLLDEATEGLAPRIVDDLIEAIRIIQREGVGVVLVEQKLKVPLALASRQYLIENGQIVWSGTTDELRNSQAEIETMVGL